MFKEFRDFINKGNVLDLAIAVIMGAAFGAIVTSLVNDLIMPLVGVLSGGIDFAGQALQIGSASIGWGNFVQTVVNFLIVAFCMFMIVRAANRNKKPAPAVVAEPPAEVKLLGEIRDLMRAQSR